MQPFFIGWVEINGSSKRGQSPFAAYRQAQVFLDEFFQHLSLELLFDFVF